MPVGVSAYVALANLTLGSTATTITFTSISQSYRDLILVINATSGNASSHQPSVRINGGTNSYNYVTMFGTGSTTGATASSGNSQISLTGNQSALRADGPLVIVAQFNDYSSTDKFKTCLSRASGVTSQVIATLGTNENTAAISSLTVMNATFASGSTFALYGIAS
jgi:hypothetical protein